MNLIEQAISDIQAITANSNEFGQEITFQSKRYSTTVTVVGLVNKIGISIDTMGNTINSKNPTIAISEKTLTDAGYPVRNADGEVGMLGDIVTTVDSTGITKKYSVNSKIPDETIGLLVFVLEDYE